MAFAVSGLASNWERLGKPFNPLLGETYELKRDDYRIVAEQVSHHPPVSAFHAEADQWFFHGSILPRLRFWGKSVEIQPKGTLTLELLRHGEAYTWSNVNCCVHNLISGQLWIEQYGTMEIVNHATGHKGVLTFKTGCGSSSKDLHKIEGYIMDKDKHRMRYLYGTLDRTSFEPPTLRPMNSTGRCTPAKFGREDVRKRSGEEGSAGGSTSSSRKMFSKLNSITSSFKISMDTEACFEHEDLAPHPEEEDDGASIPHSLSCYSLDIPNSTLLWEVTPRPPTSSQYYHFTHFAMSLNERDSVSMTEIAPTDSRLRPDIRLLEEGDIDGASNEKTRLEEKQREARKSRKKKNREEWRSRWFEQGTNPFTQQPDWLYSGRYWERKYTDIEEIF